MSRGGGRGGRGARSRYIPRGQDKLTNESGELLPPPLYPDLIYVPQPLLPPTDDCDYSYLLTLKQEYRAAMLDSPYFLKPPTKRNEIERYSDKYQLSQADSTATQKWQPDWSRLPAELRIATKKSSTKGQGTKNTQGRKRRASSSSAVEVNKKLEELAQREEADKSGDEENLNKKIKTTNEGGEKESRSDEEEEGGEEEEDDEDGEALEGNESENDYNVNYYESGESNADDSNDENAYY